MNKRHTFFYGGIFSQWHLCNINIDGLTYSCAEQYMMHQKAMMFQDLKTAKEIMATQNPKIQKELGRKVENFNLTRWNKYARDIVYKGNFWKFVQNPSLLAKLMETKHTWLVEASPHDKVWGIGIGMKDDLKEDPNNWQGANWLGQVLTKVRENIGFGIYQDFKINWKL